MEAILLLLTLIGSHLTGGGRLGADETCTVEDDTVT